MKVKAITLGGWYQRTTLHLSEIYDLFARGKSHLPLSEKKLESLQASLEFVEVKRQVSHLEYIYAKTKDNILIRYYEDGLFTLSIENPDLDKSESLLINYLDEKLTPAINYIFSLGAPTPKILANIKTTHPFVYLVEGKNLFQIKSSLKLTEIYSEITDQGITVLKTPDKIVVLSSQTNSNLESLIENQIFFREFKDQLERYLNIHRQIWEEISDIKERADIKGKQIENLRNQLDAYQKTINLIDSRLNQMSSYVRTRAAIAKEEKIETYLNQLFQYKFETLIDTHSYIKEIWRMTKDYLNTALQTINDVQSTSTKETINSLRLITTIGVVSGIFSYLSRDSLPQVTQMGIVYFILLLALTWLINKIVSLIYSNLKYKIKFIESKKL